MKQADHYRSHRGQASTGRTSMFGKSRATSLPTSSITRLSLKKSALRVIIAGAFGSTLGACGGGGGTTATGAPTYTVGGQVIGLTGPGLVLANGSDTVALAAGAANFTFAQALSSGASYLVTVKTQPTAQACTVANGSGTVTSANVTNVTVSCVSTSVGLSPIYVAMSSGQIAGLSSDLASVQQMIVTTAIFDQEDSKALGTGGQIVIVDGTLYQTGTGQYICGACGPNGAPIYGGEVVAIADIANRGEVVQYDASKDLRAYFSTIVTPSALAAGAIPGSLIIGDLATTGADEVIHLLSGFDQSHLAQSQPTYTPSGEVNASGVSAAACVAVPNHGSIRSFAYDSAADRLYAACDSGVFIAVFDNFYGSAQSGVTPTVSRTLTPGEIKLGQSSSFAEIGASGITGLAYDSATDTLFASGLDPNLSSSGAILIFNNASQLNDAPSGFGGTSIVVPDKIVSGSETQLVKPVAIAFKDGIVVVADDSKILEFNNLEKAIGSNIAPVPNISVDSATLGLAGSPISIAFP
jgi:hypothetical protein